MQFLDSVGLAYLWGKIKSKFLRLYSDETQTVNSEIKLLKDIHVTELDEHDNPRSVDIAVDGISVKIGSDTGTTIHYDSVKSDKLVKKGGTSAQVLMADGSVKEAGTANGIAQLDANGNVPLSQLGNLDTTVAEVVQSLPTSNIKNHIYLVPSSNTEVNNVYTEYLYVSGKWEKLGEFKPNVDLSPYAKKSEAVGRVLVDLVGDSKNGYTQKLSVTTISGDITTAEIMVANSGVDGLMSRSDKSKLDNIDEGANNYSLPLSASGTRGGIQLGYAANGKNYPVQLDGEKAFVYVPWTDTNTTYENATSSASGLMSASDKARLDGIASGATADSAIPTSVIDALS